MTRNKALSFLLMLQCGVFGVFLVKGQALNTPKPLRIGFSIGATSITPQKMAEAKSAGLSCIETSLAGFIDKDTRQFKLSDEEIAQKLKEVKKATDGAGIEIWSIHMPFSPTIDLSLADESERRKVVDMHKKVLKFCEILKPKIILFHPSYFLGLNERELRKSQMIKSAVELHQAVRRMRATMVIENMLGPELTLPGGKRERPLFRTVEEATEMMGRLPKDVYAAVDMNHIKYPEKLIRALGPRLKTVHVADGTGQQENHYFPCSGQGENNWNDILVALFETGYTGPFLYESAYKDLKDLKGCYESLYQAFLESRTSKYER